MSLLKMSSCELRVHAGNVAYQLWERLPEPKLDYVQWYYGTREQCLSDVLEHCQLEDVSYAKA